MENKNTVPAWEDAKPGETLENVWIPNRRDRRKMVKNQKKKQKLFSKVLGKSEDYAKNNKDFRQNIYKALYENLKEKTKNIEEKLREEQNNDSIEGN